ncbi:hypothetical protein V2J09_001793 [Rumex salicifolius]
MRTQISERRKRGSRIHGKMAERREKEAKKAKTEIVWPAIKPKRSLQLTRLKSNDLFVVQNFLTSAESKEFIKAAESRGFTHQGSLGPAKGEAYRDNDRISVNDPALAQTVWESGLSTLFNDIKIRGRVAVGLNSNIRLYRYKVGQRFGRHIDESVELEDGKHTHYTLLIYLSGGPTPKGKTDPNSSGEPEPLVGGETVFYGYRNSIVAEVAPLEGMALFHIHGDKCMLHEARNVTKGVKYVFRSDSVCQHNLGSYNETQKTIANRNINKLPSQTPEKLGGGVGGSGGDVVAVEISNEKSLSIRALFGPELELTGTGAIDATVGVAAMCRTPAPPPAASSTAERKLVTGLTDIAGTAQNWGCCPSPDVFDGSMKSAPGTGAKPHAAEPSPALEVFLFFFVPEGSPSSPVDFDDDDVVGTLRVPLTETAMAGTVPVPVA